MKKKVFYLLFALVLLSASHLAHAQWPSNVNVIRDEPNKKTKVKGKLEEGDIIGDLSWGYNSAVGCFPAQQSDKFRGNHVLYAAQLPARHKIKITLRPENDTLNLSLYAYSIGVNNTTAVVPNLHSCVSCKSAYRIDNKPKKGQVQTNVRTVELKSIGPAYNVIIGVAGAGEKAVTGGYTLEVELQ